MKYLFLVISSIFLAYLVIILFIYFYQRNLLYHPNENNYLNDKIDGVYTFWYENGKRQKRMDEMEDFVEYLPSTHVVGF